MQGCFLSCFTQAACLRHQALVTGSRGDATEPICIRGAGGRGVTTRPGARAGQRQLANRVSQRAGTARSRLSSDRGGGSRRATVCRHGFRHVSVVPRLTSPYRAAGRGAGLRGLHPSPELGRPEPPPTRQFLHTSPHGVLHQSTGWLPNDMHHDSSAAETKCRYCAGQCKL